MTAAREGHGDFGARAQSADARLDARLAAFTRYAATVSEQFSAALHGDSARAHALAEERELLGEHFAELRAPTPAGRRPDAPPFDALLAGAIEELDHQMGIELALRERLATLRDDALRLMHASHAVEPSARAAAAALVALDPAAVSGGALASLVAPAERASVAERPLAERPPAGPPESYRAGTAAHQLDVRC